MAPVSSPAIRAPSITAAKWAGLTDHSPEQRGPIRAVAQGQRQEIEIARAVQPVR
jgi:hypothetical protein